MRVALGVSLALAVFGIAGLATVMNPAQTDAATANTINFQARLENLNGSIVADGTYNVEFNLYNVGSGGSSLWTEDRLVSASQGVTVKNGYLTANLGSITSFPSNMNWGQQLWLGMTVRGTGSCAWASCTPADTEMTPRLSLTAVPAAYSLTQYNSANTFGSSLTLQAPTGGNQTFVVQDQTAAGAYNICIQNTTACGFAPSSGSSNYIQNQNSSAQTSSNFWISGTGTANLLQAATIDSPSGTTTLAIGTNNATGGINLNQNTTIASGKSLTVTNGSVFFQKGTDYATTGIQDNVNFGAGALIRLTGASAQTIQGIAGGANGRVLTLVNAAAQAATIKNNTSGTSGNSIITGTGSDLTLAAGASINLVYDSGASPSVWRVVGGTGGGGTITLGTVDSAGSANANGATLTGTTLNLNSATASQPGVVNATTQTFGGNKTFGGTLTVSPAASTTALVVTNSNGNAMVFDSTTNTFKIFENVASPTNYASISYSSGAAKFAASSGTTQIGSGTGSVTSNLIGQNDVFQFSKTYSPAAAYSLQDYQITRTLTSTTATQGGALLQIKDTSSANAGVTINPTLLLLNQASTGGAVAGNLIDAQLAGVSKFTVNTAGTITAGTWNASVIAPLYGGTGNTGYTTNGSLYYDGSKFVSTAASTGAQCLVSASAGAAPTWGSCGTGTSTTLQNAYDNSSSPATITSSSAAKTITLQSGATFNTTSFFEVKANGVSAPVLSVDTANQRVGIDMNNPGYALDVTGDINASLTLKVGGTTVCDNTGCSASPGGGNYIRNATAQQTSANYNIKSGGAGQTTAQITGSNSATVPVAIIASGSTPGAGADLLQLTDGTNVLAKFNNAGVLTLGRAGAGSNGQLVLNNSGNSNAVTLSAATSTAAYSFVLPGAAGSSGDCLKNGGTPGTLTFAACGSTGITTTLQNAYDNSSAPATITTSAGNKGVGIIAGAVPTVDLLNITNAGQAVTTAGVNALSINYVGGAAAIEAEAQRIDLQPSSTSGSTWNGVRFVANATGPASGVTETGAKYEGPTTGGAGTYNAINIANIGAVASGGTVRGINITPTNSNAAGTVRGIQLGNITAGAASEIGIDLGTGWDNLLTYNNGATVIVNGLGQLNLGTVTGTLAAGNGGTGSAFTQFSGPASTVKTFTLPNASANILTDNALVTVAQGGTGANTFTTNGVLYGNGSGAIQATAASTGANQCLITASSGGVPSWASCPGGGGGTLQAAYTGGTGGTTPEIIADSTRNGIDIQDANTTLGAGTTLLAVRASATSTTLGTLEFGVTNNGNVTYLGSLTGGSSGQFTVSNAGAIVGVGVNSGSGLIQGTGGVTATGTVQLNASGSGATTIGNASAGTLTLQGNASTTLKATSGASTTTIGFVTPTANNAINFPNAAGTVAVSATGNIALSAAGQVSFTGTLGVANGGTGATAANFNTNGVAYYDGSKLVSTATGGAGTFCLSSTNGAAPSWQTCGSGSSTTLQNAYTNSAGASPSILLTQAFGGVSIRDGSPAVSGNLFSIQNNAGTATYFGVSATGISLQNSSGVNALAFDNTTKTLKVFDSAGGTNYASITYSSSTATFAANTGTTQIGTGTGNVTSNLTGQNDTFQFSKTYSPAAAYSLQDYQITRALTSTTATQGGAVLQIKDTSTANSGVAINPTLLLINQASTVGTVSGNLIDAQLAGASKFNVNTAGNLTYLGSLAGGSAGQFSVSNAGALTAVGVNSGSGLLQGTGGLTVTGTTSINGSGTAATTIGNASAGTLTLQGNASTVLKATSGANTTTIGFVPPTAANAINFPNASGTVAVSATGNIALSAAGQISFTGTLGVSSGGTGATSFANTNGVAYYDGTKLTVTAAGTTNQCLVGNTGAAPSWGSCGTTATLQNAYTASTGGTTPEILLDSTRTTLNVEGYSGQTADLLDLSSNGAGLGTVQFGVSTAGNVTALGTYNTNTFTSSQLAFGAASAATIQSASNQNLTIQAQGSGALNLQSGTGSISLTTNSATAGITAKSSTNSTTAFRIQDASNFSFLSVDTLNGAVALASDAQLATTTTTYTAGSPITNTYSYTGGQQTFTVPAGVTSVTLEAWGAQGGGTAAGKGAYVKSTYTVIPGQTLYVYVGGQGGTNSGSSAAGGYNGGGSATSGVASTGGGGGGASDIRYGGAALSNRIMIAGGGGGSGDTGSSGGGGGYYNGLDGIMNGWSGHGGTWTSGGAGGNANGGTAGSAGSLGTGGNAVSQYDAGGGGGGGYYGGGSGASNTIVNGGSYGGGGGSSYTSGKQVTFTNAAESGNGQVKITYTSETANNNTTYTTSSQALTLNGNGVTISNSAANSTTALQVQNSSSVSFLNVDTLNNQISIAGSAATYTQPAGTSTTSFTRGSGSWTPGYGSQAILVDVNGDGKKDLLAASPYGSGNQCYLAVALGNGNGTFAGSTSTYVGPDLECSGLATGDFNGDGKVDVVMVVGSTNNAVTVLLGNGNGTFGSATSYTVGSAPSKVAVADFNGDGKPDIAVTNSSSGTFSVLMNTGTSFAAAVNYTTASGPQDIATADFNGDGAPDVVVVCNNGGVAYADVFLNNGTGSSFSLSGYSTQDSVGSGVYVTTTDVNHDGTTDFVVGMYNSSLVAYLNNGSGSFTALQLGSAYANTEGLSSADVNGDGYSDLVMGYYNAGPGGLDVMINQGNDAFSSPVTIGGDISSGDPATADLNGDGLNDVVYPMNNGPAYDVFINTSTQATSSTSYGASLSVKAASSSSGGLIIQGASSQSAKLFVIQDALGNGLLTVDASGNLNAKGTVTGGVSSPDYAENITVSDQAIGAADVVAMDPDHKDQIVKAVVPYDSKVMGVISTHPGFVTNASNADGTTATDQRPLALSGRVPVKVSTENGAIKPGDYLTSSDIPGVAMKATGPGAVIGVAMEAFDGTEGNDTACGANDQYSCGTVLFFINPSATNPSAETAVMQGGDAVLNSLTVNGALAASSINVGGLASVTGLAVSGDASVGGSLSVAGSLSVTGMTLVADITVGGHILTTGNTPAAQLLPGAGSSNATVTIDGNDVSGTITVTTGDPSKPASQNSPAITGPSGGDMVRVTFTKAYGKTPRILITPADGKSAPLLVYPSGMSATGFTLSLVGTPAANTSYNFEYFIIQ